MTPCSPLFAPNRTGLIWDQRFGEHDTGPGHPERPERLEAVHAGLEAAGLLCRCATLQPRAAGDDELLLVHTPEYLQRLEERCRRGARYIDTPESTIGPSSAAIARLAAGAVLVAVDAVMAGTVDNAFCAVRPPGHHCEADRAMGFCLLGNVALAAAYLRSRHGLERIAVLDWDVHHGNGTQHLFEETDAVFFCSLHGHPAVLYPGTGYAEERGRGAGAGATLNIPMSPGADDSDYRRAFDTLVLPALHDYRPQFVLISCGFDAHRCDPLGPLDLESSSYAWMTQAARAVAGRHAGGRMVSVLEGGYDLTALAESAAAHVGALLGDTG